MIEIILSGIDYNGGPGTFVKGINEVLPYSISKCHFIASTFKTKRRAIGRINSDYYYLPFPHLKEKVFNKLVHINKVNKLILGPCFLPHNWFLFPDTIYWSEKRVGEIIKIVKGIGVHSIRVRDHLAQRSNTTNMLYKYKIIRPCSNIQPKNVKPFNERNIDIIFFEKYKDLNHSQQGEQMWELLKNSSKVIERIEYGNFTQNQMIKLANDSKFIIYFSFYDTGAIALKEIQNYGVLSFTLQNDLVIDRKTSFFIPELENNDLKSAYIKINQKINEITKLNPNTILIAKRNQEINKCQNSLKDLCQNII